MDKLLEMEEQLKKNVGAMDEESKAKLAEAIEYIKEHGTPEVRQRLKNFVLDGFDEWKHGMEELIAKYQQENNEEALSKIEKMLEELKR